MQLLINQNSLGRKAKVNIAAFSFLVLGSLLSAGDVLAEKPTVGPPVKAKEFKVDLRLLPKAKLWQKGDPITEIPLLILPEDSPNYQAPSQGPGATGSDGALDYSTSGMLGVTPPGFSTANPNFAGIGATGFTPPDTNGDVGPNHYIQMLNAAISYLGQAGKLASRPTNLIIIWANSDKWHLRYHKQFAMRFPCSWGSFVEVFARDRRWSTFHVYRHFRWKSGYSLLVTLHFHLDFQMIIRKSEFA